MSRSELRDEQIRVQKRASNLDESMASFCERWVDQH
jgi:hypothetical protein